MKPHEHPDEEATREFVEEYARHVGGTVIESEHFFTVVPNKELPCVESD